METKIVYLLDFLKQIDENIIDESHIELYEDFLSGKNNFKNLSQILKSDYKTALKYSYNLLSDSLIKDDEIKLNEDLSNDYNTPIYNLDDSFKILIHVTMAERLYHKFTKFMVYKDFSSLSLISDGNLKTFRNPKKNIILGFNKINPDKIKLVYENDAYTSDDGKSNIITPIYTPDSLVKSTKHYNEILYKNDDLLPDYVVAYNKIYKGDIDTSIMYDVPIVLVKR